MFGKLNESWSNIFNKTNRSEDMLPPNHKCNENGCNGARFSGINLTCTRCLMPKFLDCIFDRTEIAGIINSLNIKPDIVASQQTITENQLKLRECFGSDSLFEFICPQCKTDGSFTKIKNKYEAQIKALDDKVKTSQKKNTDQKKEMKKFEDEIKDLNMRLNNDECNKCTSLSSENEKMKIELRQLKENVQTNSCIDCANNKIENDNLKVEIMALKKQMNENKCVRCDEQKKCNEFIKWCT